MAASNVDISLADDTHPKVVKGSAEEAGEGGHEDHGAVTASHANTDASQILLANEAFDMPFGKDFTKFLAESGVFHVAIQSTDTVVVFSNLDKCCSISLSSCQFIAFFVAWSLI